VAALHVIKIPDIGEGIAEVELVAWHVAPGDTVQEDQALADVMTDKATVEIPSPVNGKVLVLGGVIGQMMAVGSELIRIEIEGEAPREAKAHGPRQVPAAEPAAMATAATAAGATPAGATKVQAPTAAQRPAPSTLPAARAPAAAAAALVSVANPRAQVLEDRPIASPSVRRRAWELGVDLKSVTASGTAGRIMHADLDAHVARVGTGVAMPMSRAPVGAVRDDQEKIPVVGLRRKIAQRMQLAKRHIPHFTYVEEIDMTELEALRSRLNAKRDRPHLTLLPFLMRAVVEAVRDFPQVNAHFDDEAGIVNRFGAVHVGIATQTGAGLLVPVVRQAQTLDLWASANELARVAQSARDGKATRDDLSGSTITITSLGPIGGIVTTPIINHPEVAIVGVNRIVTRPVMWSGAVVPRQMMNLSSSFDHRVIDGQVAAEFVQALRGRLECPAALFIG
jgi:2-oxoisovalerate dehydrogenase E2 component (dihydrolipoyl transacylase)